MNFNILSKFKPVTCFLTQTVFMNYKNRLRIQPKNFSQPTPSSGNLFMLSALLSALLWPSKKEKENDLAALPMLTLETADTLFDNGQYEQCYDLLKEHEHNELNVEVQWRICRVLYNMSKELKYDKSYKDKLMLKAFEIISKQLEHHEDHYAVHKWYALLLDAKSSQDGIKERIRQLENVKRHMDLAVTLHPNDATILYMLGEWCYQIAELPWHQRKIAEVIFATPPYSTYEEALEYFLKAEEVQPRFYSLNLLRIGLCYYRLDKGDQAKYYLKLAASYPAKSNDDHKANKEASEFLKKLK